MDSHQPAARRIISQIQIAAKPGVIEHIGFYNFVCTADFLRAWQPHTWQRHVRLPVQMERLQLLGTIRAIVFDFHKSIPHENILKLEQYFTRMYPNRTKCIVGSNRLAINFY